MCIFVEDEEGDIHTFLEGEDIRKCAFCLKYGDQNGNVSSYSKHIYHISCGNKLLLTGFNGFDDDWFIYCLIM